MTRHTLINLAITMTILAGGCAANYVRTQVGPRQADMIQPKLPETILKDVRLNQDRSIQKLRRGDLESQTRKLVREVAQEFGGRAGEVEVEMTTVSKLMENGLFLGSVLAGDQVVVSAEAHAAGAKNAFVQQTMDNGQLKAFRYTKLVMMLNPANLELLSLGLVP